MEKQMVSTPEDVSIAYKLNRKLAIAKVKQLTLDQ